MRTTPVTLGPILLICILAPGCPAPTLSGQQNDAAPTDDVYDPPHFREAGCTSSDGGFCPDGGGPARDATPADMLAPDTCAPAIPSACPVIFRLADEGQTSVELAGTFNAWGVAPQKRQAMTKVGTHWQTSVTLAHGKTVEYKFVTNGATWKPDPCHTNSAGPPNHNSTYKVTCAATCGAAKAVAICGGETFDWRDGVMYFAMLDRFSNGDKSNDAPKPANVKAPANWHGGDLAGLLAKIKSGYFKKVLGGVNVIWITSPIDVPDGGYAGRATRHYSKQNYSGYHGYWPAKLDTVENHLGDLKLLKQVVAEAHKAGIKVVLDYVMNHVHSSSPVYAQHKSWFYPSTYQGHSCVCGAGCSWDKSPDKERCWFEPYLADFDFTQSAARSFSVANAIKWVKDTDIDGYRLDAIKHIDKRWLTDLRRELGAQAIKPGERFYLVGETYSGDRALIKSYVAPSMLDGQFDFPMRAKLVEVILRREKDFNDLDGFLRGNDHYYGSGAIMGTFLGNHDLPRTIHLGEDTPLFGIWDTGQARAWSKLPTQPTAKAPYERLAVAFTALLTLRGVPLIYYGDEIGLAGGGDPDNRRSMPWSGATSNQLGLRAHIAKLVAFRAKHKALSRGTRKRHQGGSDRGAKDVYVYSMTLGSDRVVVVLNRSDTQQTVVPKPALPNATYTDALSGRAVQGASITIGPRSSMVLQ